LKNDTAYKVKQNLPASDSSLEGSLDVIPEWREFVLSGKERGLDVMGILKVAFLFYYLINQHAFRILKFYKILPLNVDLDPSLSYIQVLKHYLV
jgi:hypothetical protein